jgi:hypothetical protein
LIFYFLEAPSWIQLFLQTCSNLKTAWRLDYAVGFVVSGAGDLNLANTMSAQPRQDMFLHLDFYIDRLVTGLSYEHNQVFGQIEIKSRT